MLWRGGPRRFALGSRRAADQRPACRRAFIKNFSSYGCVAWNEQARFAPAEAVLAAGGLPIRGTLDLRIAGGVTIAVPAILESMTTYVLLEQEAWFEKEMCFLRRWLKPGMAVIDIGANLGVYSLPLARLVGPHGRVFAYEPGSAPRGCLERSRDLNRAHNLEIAAQALSAGEAEGHLVFGGSSELSALGTGGKGEPVRITSLDIQDRERQWPAPDFVKIDAEGEEERIIAGGCDFFSRYSPLVMFEIKAGSKFNDKLRSIFPSLGYGLYRALPDAPFLVPIEPEEKLDDYELNLFAAKPDRARLIAQRGLLIDQVSAWEPGEDSWCEALALLKGSVFGPAFPGLFDGSVVPHPGYRDGLAAFAVWMDRSRPPSVRCAALSFAFCSQRALCAAAPSAARLATFARISWHWGKRHECVKALWALLAMIEGRKFPLMEPFWPACPRFDALKPRKQADLWFAAATAEQYERAANFSSYFSGPTPVIEWLCNQPFAPAQMDRRRTLLAARAGLRPVTPKRLGIETDDNLNAVIWRAGKVPGCIKA